MSELLNRLIALALTYLPACGSPPAENRPSPADHARVAEASAYIAEFMTECRLRGGPVARKCDDSHYGGFYFVDSFVQGDDRIGQATMPTFMGDHILPSTITILRSYWDATTPEGKRALVFHEASHAILLRREHMPNDALSLMRPNMLPQKLLKEHWPELVEELFK